MTALRLAEADPATVQADALVVGVFSTDRGPRLAPAAAGLERAFGGRAGLSGALGRVGATGKAEEVTRLAVFDAIAAGTVLAVGLGPVPPRGAQTAAETLRRAAGAATRALAGARTAAFTLAGANRDGTTGVDRPQDVAAVAEGIALGGYAFQRFRTSAGSNGTRPALRTATVLADGARGRPAKAALHRAEVVSEAVSLCRDLVNTPAGDLHPADLAAAARDAGRPLGLTVTVLDEKALAKGGYGGILGVGQGSANPPRLVSVRYRPESARRTVALVGKGITFDSGGLSLKPSGAMETMKCDMSGAAAVLATVVAAARLQLPIAVTGWIPTAENMPGGAAIRPSDVLTMYGGRTVEVLNTDAEGRLILADALVRAGEDRPDAIIDLATLTGAQVVALGSRVFAVMGNDERLRAAVVDAADAAGEGAWPMPLPPDLRRSLDSDVADLKNIGDRNGGMLTAGLFLSEFVPDGTPWAHLDIAGPAFNTADPWGYTPKGGTGAGIRTVLGYLESLPG